jgi:hypothetical protein
MSTRIGTANACALTDILPSSIVVRSSRVARAFSPVAGLTMGSISSNAATAPASTALKKKKNRNISDKRKQKRKNTRKENNLVGLDRE